MAEINNETLRAFADQMNNITEQFLEMRESVKNIEDNICEVNVINGGDLPITIRTKDLLEKLHEYTKPGGSIDKKIKAQADTHTNNCAVHQKKFSDDLDKCRKEHSFMRRLTIFNKSGNTIIDSLKIAGFFLFLIFSGWGWYESYTARKEANKDKQERIQLTKKVQMLEKLIEK